MATIKSVVRNARADGFLPVYIRVVHKSKPGYIRTNKVVAPNCIGKSGEIKDPVVNEYCSIIIRRYYDMLNRMDCHNWSVREVIEYLTSEDDDVCFSDYARQHISRLRNNGQDRTARNYELVLGHLERYFGTTKVMFSQLTSTR